MTANQRNYVIGGLAVASAALLAYSVTRPRKLKSKKKRSHNHDKNNIPKGAKYSIEFEKQPIEISVCMYDMNGFSAHVSAEKKNSDNGLKYGSRLIKINNKRVDSLLYEEIYETLQHEQRKVSSTNPLKLTFRECPTLCEQWKKSAKLKEEANKLYKAGKVKEALPKLSEAIDLHPTNKVLYSNRVLMYLKIGEFDKALDDCHTIRELDPKSVYIKGHYLRGLVLHNQKKYKHAAAAFQTVIKLEPEFKQATDRLNQCLQELEKEKKKKESRRSIQNEQLSKTLIDAAVLSNNENDNNNNNDNKEVPKTVDDGDTQ